MTDPLKQNFDLDENPPPVDAKPDPSTGAAPGVFIVREGRPASGRLLPPLLIVLTGVSFLAYRSGRADWRGFDFLRNASWPSITWKPRAWSAPQPKAVATPQPAPQVEPGPALALKTPEASPKPDSPEATPAEAVAKGKAADSDPLDEIALEAERTKERLAELERAKEEAAKRLDETADERKREDRAQRGARGLFGLRGMDPGEMDKLMEEMQRQQTAMFEAFERDARQHMEEMRRGFLGGRMPGMPGPGMAFPFGQGNAGPAVRGPAAGGNWPPNVEFRESRGPGGVRRFEMRWSNVRRAPRPGDPQTQDKNDENDGVPPPPVPQPEPRRID